ncbi:P1 family peptidase [Pyxidicoccus fallax]|uniref:P1 family peptidase n=1 Tax=Pyxidicoccus fallax TaxID=394095 RepID=A0A848LQF1_9BACT|nr:P1 family peptidase [Pyxidicoccus fallax]NMO20128.1 P1 family peptidase [Pyxidicoccus fallax]NPC80831.1 P1 family peptidase [Pyxidicoccus fallax]
MTTLARTLPPSVLLCLLTLASSGFAQSAPTKPRARDLGITFGGKPGANNAITDVPGVEVGHTTLNAQESGARTGVTAVLPRGKDGVAEPVFAATFALNGNGEMTGTHWVDESGELSGPVMITNTNDIGAVRDGVITWAMKRDLAWELGLPIVAETWDGYLSDIGGFHVKAGHAHQALDTARGGPVAEGSVGGGTGMMCHGFKGGIGTASRKLTVTDGGYTVGVLVQCNYGSRRLLSVEGVPVGEEINDLQPCYVGAEKPTGPFTAKLRPCSASSGVTGPTLKEGTGSIIIVVGTDAPLLPHQLKRIARRVALGLGKMGGLGENSSGDIFLAFSTQRLKAPEQSAARSVSVLDNEQMNPLFEATVQATQEAILNSMLAAETMTSARGIRVFPLPHDRLVKALKKYGRLASATAKEGQKPARRTK